MPILLDKLHLLTALKRILKMKKNTFRPQNYWALDISLFEDCLSLDLEVACIIHNNFVPVINDRDILIFPAESLIAKLERIL